MCIFWNVYKFTVQQSDISQRSNLKAFYLTLFIGTLLISIYYLTLAWFMGMLPMDLTNENDSAVEISQLRAEADKYYSTLPEYLTEDANMIVPDIIRKYGYPSEVHKVVTKDGYTDEMHRIPYGRSGPSKNRPAVYLQHGLLSSSADWIITGPGQGLAYILADAGYDVWVSNIRGTRYSRKHRSYHPEKHAAKFWDFSWHDIGVDDVAVMIDYVINTSKQAKIFYIGHSQGTTVFYVLCSEKPQYNDKIRAMFSLAPTGYLRHMTNPVMQFIAKLEPLATKVTTFFGNQEFLPTSKFMRKFGKSMCADSSIFQILCTNVLFVICGFNKEQMNKTLLPVIMGHTPAGASSKQFLHYGQGIRTGEFRKFDYGWIANQFLYNSIIPPSYNILNIKVPLYFYYSKNDLMANPKDVNILYRNLRNSKCKCIHEISDKNFNHIGFLYSMNAPKVLYSKILDQMQAISECYVNRKCKCSRCIK